MKQTPVTKLETEKKKRSSKKNSQQQNQKYSESLNSVHERQKYIEWCSKNILNDMNQKKVGWMEQSVNSIGRIQIKNESEHPKPIVHSRPSFDNLLIHSQTHGYCFSCQQEMNLWQVNRKQIIMHDFTVKNMMIMCDECQKIFTFVENKSK